MRRDAFAFLAETVHRNSGIVLETDKDYLVESRLRTLAKDRGHSTVEALIIDLQQRPNRRVIDDIVDRLTTNETSFFRDVHPYEVLRESVFPELIKANEGSRRLHIWSMACSTGQEPYSLLMVLRQHFPFVFSWDFRLLATDISTTALDQARAARYSKVEIARGLPDAYREDYLVSDGNGFRMAESLRSQVTFKEANITGPLSVGGPFDLILLRNVLIYFNDDTKARVFRNARTNLAPHGRLMLGSTETVPGHVTGFQRLVLPKVSVFSHA